MNYELYPGRKLNKKNFIDNEVKPIISIIMPFYNSKKYIQETVNSVLNQTYPFFELIIVNDGSTDKESLEILENIERQDTRIKVYHNQNRGVSYSRDYGATKSSESVKYLFFLDDDDVINSTYLECAYWTLETNKDASWAYTDLVNFYGKCFEWIKWFDIDKVKKENFLVVTAMVRKSDYIEVKGFNIKEKAVYEDWNFWLKLLAKGKYPVRMNFIGFWYRKKAENESELQRSSNDIERASKYALETAKTIKDDISAIQYPKEDYNWDGIDEEILKTIQIPKAKKDNKINVLMIIPWMVTGGADKFNLDLISRLDKEKYNFIIVSTLPNENRWRQDFEEHATIYDLTTFLDRKYWTAFIKYLIEVNNIDLIFNTNSTFGYVNIPYLKCEFPEIPIIDYVHMEEWYNRNGGFSRDTSAVASCINKTLVCNKNTEKILINYFKRCSEDIETIYIGVDEKKFKPENEMKNSVLQKYGIDIKGRYIISFIARIDYQKRPFLLMEIIKKVKKSRTDILFLIAGDGPLLESIKQIAKKDNLQDMIIFLGNIKETKEVYSISDLTINCSIKEGLALTSYESLAMGVPVISSDVGGQAELINNNVGVIVPCLQEEKDVYDTTYKTEEIDNYVHAIDITLENLEQYKKESRERILNGFTIDNMVESMDRIFTEEIIRSKNNNQKNIYLKDFKDITLELINYYLVSTKAEYHYLAECWNISKFGCYIKKNNNDKVDKIREILWKNALWRLFVKTIKKLGIKK